MKDKSDTYHFSSISQLMRYLGQPAPLHPLIGWVDYSKGVINTFEKGTKISLDFYKISFKKEFSGQVKYGQGYYDFEEGGLAFLKPKQIVISSGTTDSYEGCVLYFHPDFIRNYPLGQQISQYGFFSYDVAEALFLSAKEKDIIGNLFATIAGELETNIDQFSQDILVAQMELLLSYSNRFYNRQFITRKTVNHQLIASLDQLLDDYFNGNSGLKEGLPSVQLISARLNLSPRYLSDMLRSLTGLNTQQYIQNKIIDYAKDLLSATALSVAEIAYRLGFEHPQSFSKLFRTKTDHTPLAYRRSFS
ncbi:helix-turn-helix domain-containing protein [Chitinophaga varians]|uniref:helix-turn-helix domain-containing protein n=1 Tax=Chitinophaga varians TaxID=2202339 RepID=UPI00165FECB6|nr:helix-turn-helix transcriptional regulator [Chitinophaga varians]MBC9912322.1 AraC family transcriptional regulator [Chitinophaga varians]